MLVAYFYNFNCKSLIEEQITFKMLTIVNVMFNAYICSIIKNYHERIKR